MDQQLVAVTKIPFRLGNGLPRGVATDLRRRLEQNPHVEVSDAQDAWVILQSFESAEYRQTSKSVMCVGVPLVEQFLADRSTIDRLRTKHPVFALVLEPDQNILFADLPNAQVVSLTRRVRWMGASVTQTISDATVVIALRANMNPNSAYQQAIRAGIKIGSPSWIESLWTSGVEQPITPLLPLQGLRLNGEVRHEQLKRTGAQIDQLEYCQVAIALTSSDDIVARAGSLHIPVVGTHWLVESIKAGHALPAQDYPVPEELPLSVSENLYLEAFMIDISFVLSEAQAAARVDINNGGGMWSLSGEAHEELQLLNAVLVDISDGEKFMCPKSGNWLKQTVVRGVPVLKRSWLTACADNNSLVPWKKFKTDVHFTDVEGVPRFLCSMKSDVSMFANTQSTVNLEDRHDRTLCTQKSTLSLRPAVGAVSSQAVEPIFQNYILAICGEELPKERFDQLKLAVAERGGKLVQGKQVLAERRIDYVIVMDGKKPSDCKELENRGPLYKKNVTSLSWLVLCVMRNTILKVPNSLLPNLQPGILSLSAFERIFEGYVFHLSNWEKYDLYEKTILPDERSVRYLCKQLGASVCKHKAWDKVTHYIVMARQVKMNEKYKAAQARDIPIVHYRWVCDSFRKGRRLEIDAYLVVFDKEKIEENLDFYKQEAIMSDCSKLLDGYILRFTTKALLAENSTIVTVAQDAGAKVDLYGTLLSDPGCHVLIYADNETPEGNKEVEEALANVQWLVRSVRERRVLSLEQFAPINPVTLENAPQYGIRWGASSAKKRRLLRATAEQHQLESEAFLNAERQLRKE
eukprot:GEMP01005103.1.p1 GENE.GEMP01005103.1~~GEMP01005103.1.p1  ORF type:complete len:805 (+),score=181.00 GEMP01005103.1:194-2608(+)